MKNIETILKEAGVELTEEQKAKILEGVRENYKTINDYQKHVDKADALQKTLDSTQKSLDEAKESLQKLEGVDVDALNKKIEDLTKQIKDNETEYNSKIAERDFNELLEKAVTNAKGRNLKAIRALLDIEQLKGSKNQKEDMDAAIRKLAEAEDSKMLFGDPEPENKGKGNPIGEVRKTGEESADTLHSALAEHYN